jgi:hypothetical protein
MEETNKRRFRYPNLRSARHRLQQQPDGAFRRRLNGSLAGNLAGGAKRRPAKRHARPPDGSGGLWPGTSACSGRAGGQEAARNQQVVVVQLQHEKQVKLHDHQRGHFHRRRPALPADCAFTSHLKTFRDGVVE